MCPGLPATRLTWPCARVAAPQATFESLASQVNDPYYRPNGPLALSTAVLPAILALYRGEQPVKAWLSAPQLAAALRSAEDATGPLNSNQFGLLNTDPSQ